MKLSTVNLRRRFWRVLLLCPKLVNSRICWTWLTYSCHKWRYLAWCQEVKNLRLQIWFNILWKLTKKACLLIVNHRSTYWSVVSKVCCYCKLNKKNSSYISVDDVLCMTWSFRPEGKEEWYNFLSWKMISCKYLGKPIISVCLCILGWH